MNPTETTEDERPCLKPGCQFRPESFEGQDYLILENPNDGTFFRCGHEEADFFRQLDGSRTVRELLTEAPAGLSPQERAELLGRAAHAGLLTGPRGKPPTSPLPPNPIFLKFPLGNPERFFDLLQRWTNPLFSQLGAAAAIALVIWGAWSITTDLSAFTQSLGGVFSLINAPALFVIFVLLKILHEIGHGLVCHRLGGHIPEWGVCLIFFFPLSYIDATSSWRIRSRWGRIAVSAAGMGTEALLAAMAAIVWANTDDGLIRTLCANLILLATVTTILFNANPLMRYDGYFIVADAVGIPNLYSKASQAASAALQTWCLGIETPRSSWPLTAYGLACLGWRILVMATICVSAIAILHGIGILLVALTMAGLALPLIARSRRFVAAAKISGQPWKWWRPAISALLVSVLLFAPLVPLAPIPGIIVLSVLDPVRVACPGFIEEVFVKDGDSVTRDQILFRLSNPEQSARLGQLYAANRRAETLALEYARGQRHELQARQEAIAQGLAEQIREASKLIASLELRAPCDGQIVGPRLSDLAGAFERTGKELTSVGHLNSVEVLAAIPQNRLSQIPLTPARRAEAYLPGRNVVISGTVSSFEQSATRQIRKNSLAANSGGPLAVRSSRTSNPSGDIELAEPVVYFSITPNEPQSGWNEGEPVVVRIPGAGRSTLFGEAISNFRRFWDQASHRFEASP